MLCFKTPFVIVSPCWPLAVLLSFLRLRRKKYENPITKDTQQPDKVLFDKAIDDIEHGRFEVAPAHAQTLMNTYDTSEYLAKAKLAIADSWYREGGAHGLAQAEAEYKDFILFYPTMEESAEAQEKVCMIHYKQMEKADRDPKHALRAEDECRQLSGAVPEQQVRAPRRSSCLREIQEVLADKRISASARFYHTKGSYPAAANRLQGLTDIIRCTARRTKRCGMLADSYRRWATDSRTRAPTRTPVSFKEYPLSAHARRSQGAPAGDEAPFRRPIRVAYARMKYELENRSGTGHDGTVWGMFRKSPDVSLAAKSGSPAMTPCSRSVPASVPQHGAPGSDAELTPTLLSRR